MEFNVASVKLGNKINTYNSNSNKASSVFNKKFYSVNDVNKNNYDSYEEIDYNAIDIDTAIKEANERMNEEKWYETAFKYGKIIRDYGLTWNMSIVCGALELVENVGDALIMCGGKSASFWVSLFDKEAAERIKDGASKAVAYDWTEALYDEAVDLMDVDDEIAHGIVHKVGSAVGTTAAYVALSCVPGGAAVTATVGAVTAFGSASEMALQCGANFDEAYLCGTAAGIAGALTGGALNKVQGAARASTSLLQVGGYALMGAGVAATEPFLNTTTQYFVYGKDAVDENGNPIYDNYGDYYVKSGGLLQTGIAAVVGGTSTGIQGVKGYNTNKYKQEFNASMDAMSDSERSKAWEDYYKQKYGDAVEHTSGKYNFERYKASAVSRYGQDIYDKAESVIQNPKYYDPDTGFTWPKAEGALEYIGMTNEELYEIGTMQGIEGLKEKGATICVFEEGKIDTRIGASYGEYSGASMDSINSRALAPNAEFSAAKDLHVYKNIDDWTTIDQDMIDSAVYGESFTGYSQVATGDKITRIVKVETTAAPWFDSPGGAKQYVYYGVKADGTIATKVLKDGEKQLYKFSMDQLMHMGIINDITSSIDTELLDPSLISRLPN